MQVISGWDADVIADRVAGRKTVAISVPETFVKSKSNRKQMDADTAVKKSQPQKSAQQVWERSDRKFAIGWEQGKVVRDQNGCFLGVLPLAEAKNVWPEVRSSFAVIVVPSTVPFADAASVISGVKSFDTTFIQRRYKLAVEAASRFPGEHVENNADEFWEHEIDRPVRVYDNTSKPIGVVTPRYLQRVLGDGWFLVSEEEAQVMTTMSAGRVRKALQGVREDVSRSGDDVMADVPKGMRAVLSVYGVELYRCGEVEFGQVYKRVLRVMPAGSYDVSLKGVRLKKSLSELGYESSEAFKIACSNAAERNEWQEMEEMCADAGTSLAVLDSKGRVLYKCGSKRAKAVRPRIMGTLPKGSFVETSGALKLRMPLQDLGFSSKDEFRKFCSGNHEKQRMSIRQEASKVIANGDVSFEGPEHVLHVFKGTIACRRRGHKIESATGIITSLSGSQLRLNVNYCTNCRLYFIGRDEYQHYRERYGPVLGNFSFEGSWSSGGYGYEANASESPLMLAGYNVRELEGLTAKERHLILANVMDRRILDKARVIEYLQFFIRSNRNRRNMGNACAKWSADLEWVRAYRIDRQRHFTVSEVSRFR